MEDTFHDAEISKNIPGEPVVFQLYGSVRLPAAPLLKYNPFFDDYTAASGDR